MTEKRSSKNIRVFENDRFVKPRILISAYACSPYEGSEPGMGWNWVSRISEKYETWVLTDDVFAKQCKRYIELNKIDKSKLHIIGIKRPGGGPGEYKKYWDRFWLIYLTQNIWQRRAFYVAKKLHRKLNFDLFHQLNMIGYREPGYLWKIEDKPFVWGPIGGHAQISYSYLFALGFKDMISYGFRNVLNYLQMRFSCRVKKAINSASLLLAATTVDENTIRSVHHRNVLLLNETGTEQITRIRIKKKKWGSNSIKLVWSGLFISRKALPLGLYAIARARSEHPELNLHLSILGDGPCARKWKELSEKLGLRNICSWKGRLSHSAALREMNKSDVMIFTSLLEGTPHSVAEAISRGIPVVCHDACGMGDLITDQCGIKISMINPRESIVGFSNAIVNLAKNRTLVERLSYGAVKRSKEITWEKKVNILSNKYNYLIRK